MSGNGAPLRWRWPARLRALRFQLQALRTTKGADILGDYFGFELANGKVIPVRQ
jgi:hypothetical protein